MPAQRSRNVPSAAVAVLNHGCHGSAGFGVASTSGVAELAVPTMSQSCPVRVPGEGAVLMAFTWEEAGQPIRGDGAHRAARRRKARAGLHGLGRGQIRRL